MSFRKEGKLFNEIQFQLDVLLMRSRLVLEKLTPVRESAKEEWVLMEGVVNEIYQLTLRLEQRVKEKRRV